MAQRRKVTPLEEEAWPTLEARATALGTAARDGERERREKGGFIRHRCIAFIDARLILSRG